MPSSPSRQSRRSPASRIFDHLTEDERIDMACEILARGVFKLAEKRGLLASQNKASSGLPDKDGKAA